MEESGDKVLDNPHVVRRTVGRNSTRDRVEMAAMRSFDVDEEDVGDVCRPKPIRIAHFVDVLGKCMLVDVGETLHGYDEVADASPNIVGLAFAEEASVGE